MSRIQVGSGTRQRGGDHADAVLAASLPFAAPRSEEIRRSALPAGLHWVYDQAEAFAKLPVVVSLAAESPSLDWVVERAIRVTHAAAFSGGYEDCVPPGWLARVAAHERIAALTAKLLGPPDHFPRVASTRARSSS